MAAKLAGPPRSSASTIVKSKFALARELGCTHTLSARDDQLVTAVQELTSGGVDYAFEVSGNRGAMTIAFDFTRRSGEVVCMGLESLDARFVPPHSGGSRGKGYSGHFHGEWQCGR
ncbi:zinc-binding dehydrogenase [Rhodococcus koreensis]|uniref:zinc-binding dehydrogenase n=1 Tax=Rhodococcus koreensis TaxID=99653 RepID=UPI00366FA75F